jgi:hypothetical protein
MSRNNFTDGSIFFHGLLENRTSKVLGLFISVLLSILVSASASGVIWYERFGSDLQRIFTNKMVSSVCWSILSFYGFTQLPELVFYLLPGFSESFCFLYLILRNSVVIQITLFLDVIVIVRYAQVFWLKNPLGFKDDFWSFLMNIWIVMFR